MPKARGANAAFKAWHSEVKRGIFAISAPSA